MAPPFGTILFENHPEPRPEPWPSYAVNPGGSTTSPRGEVQAVVHGVDEGKYAGLLFPCPHVAWRQRRSNWL